MLVAWLTPLLAWLGIGLVPLLLIIIIILMFLKN